MRWLLVVGRWLGCWLRVLCVVVLVVAVVLWVWWWVGVCFGVFLFVFVFCFVLVLCLVCCVVGLSLDQEGKGGRSSVLSTGRQDEALRTGPPGPGRALAFYRYS